MAKRDQNDVHKYGERGERVVFDPVINAEGQSASPTEQRGQTGNSAAQSDRRIPPTGGSSTAPPKTQK